MFFVQKIAQSPFLGLKNLLLEIALALIWKYLRCNCSKYRGLLRSQMGTAARDIVQFVEMRKFRYPDGSWDRETLAKEVLAEIPNQVVKWMTIRGIKPPKS